MKMLWVCKPISKLQTFCSSCCRWVWKPSEVFWSKENAQTTGTVKMKNLRNFDILGSKPTFLASSTLLLGKTGKCVFPALKSFWWLTWYCNCYQWVLPGLRSINNNYDMSQKCIDCDLEAKNEVSWFLEKAFLEWVYFVQHFDAFKKKNFFKKLLCLVFGL